MVHACDCQFRYYLSLVPLTERTYFAGLVAPGSWYLYYTQFVALLTLVQVDAAGVFKVWDDLRIYTIFDDHNTG